MKTNRLYIFSLLLMLLTSCSTTKYIPDDDYLFTGLTKIEYKDYEDNENFYPGRD